MLDGDGSLLMQLGSLVSIAHAQPRNLYHFVFANGVHETTGNQPLPGVGKFDFCVLAMGAGYQGAFSLNTKEEFEEQLPQILDTPGPVLVNLVIEGEGTRGGSARGPDGFADQGAAEELRSRGRQQPVDPARWSESGAREVVAIGG